ncbi:MAG: DJ-1/PfpI family protein [Lachnospiraceae bacterium]|nr:DJ-1/PfpI family protein [Lachnospiraceae bacterium]
MKKIAVFFGEGFEEIEALTVVDICRRAGIEVDMVSITGKEVVNGAHKIAVGMDKQFEEVDFASLDMIVLPGGMPGTRNLEAHEGLMAQVDAFYQAEKWIGAICAAPSIFGHRGILKGRQACCFPGFEKDLEGATVTTDNVTVDGHVITSRGMGTAMDFGLCITALLCNEEVARELAEKIIYK